MAKKPQYRCIDDDWRTEGEYRGKCAYCQKDVYTNDPHWTGNPNNPDNYVLPLHEDCVGPWRNRSLHENQVYL